MCIPAEYFLPITSPWPGLVTQHGEGYHGLLFIQSLAVADFGMVNLCPRSPFRRWGSWIQTYFQPSWFSRASQWVLLISPCIAVSVAFVIVRTYLPGDNIEVRNCLCNTRSRVQIDAGATCLVVVAQQHCNLETKYNASVTWWCIPHLSPVGSTERTPCPARHLS